MLTRLAVPFVDTCAADLAWSLAPPAPGHVSLGHLVLRDDRRGAGLALHVLGASHAVRVTLDGVALEEVVACRPGEAGTAQPLPVDRSLDRDGLGYRFRSSTQQLPAAGLAELAGRLRDVHDGSDRSVVGVFPGSRCALTVLSGSLLPTGAAWTTWHLYPSSGEVVRTTSLVRAGGVGRARPGSAAASYRPGREPVGEPA